MNSVSVKGRWGVFLLILLVTMSYQLILAFSLTPLGAYEGCDSLVFKQMGLAILQGKVPYLELFDHKGPVIYFINAFSQWLIPGRWGLFLLFCINIAAATYVWWLIASLFVKSRSTVWPIAIGLFSYILVLSDGNLTEEWSLLPISYCLYVFVRHFVEGKEISAKAFFLIGISLGVVTFLRINNMAASCCAILVYTVYHLCRKTTVTPIKLLESLIVMFLGWLSFITVCCLVIWALYGSQGVEEMIYGTFTFNFEYMSAPTAVATDRRRVYLFYGLTTLVILLLLFLKKKVTPLTILITLCYIGSFAAIGNKGWGNYFVIFAPVTVVATACLYEVLNRWQKILIFLMFFFLIPLKFYMANQGIYQDQVFYEEADKVILKIPEEEKNHIWNSASFDGLAVLNRHGLTQANRVMLHFQLPISERLLTFERESFERINPVWIIAAEPFQEKMSLSLDSIKVTNDYALQAVTGEGAGRRLYIYKRK